MISRCFLFATVVALLVAPMAGATTDAYAPRFVAVENAGAFALVTWAPGAEIADSYRVYGIEGSSLVLLASTSTFNATVPGDYATYAVSGVSGDAESEPTRPCIEIELLPPNVVLVPPCDEVPPGGSLPPVGVKIDKP